MAFNFFWIFIAIYYFSWRAIALALKIYLDNILEKKHEKFYMQKSKGWKKRSKDKNQI
jgi:hypothetical protein